MIRYIQEMIDMMNTEDQETNESNKELLVEQISKKLKEEGKEVEKEKIA